MYQALLSVLTNLKNELKNRSWSKQQEGRIHRPETVWLFKWKEVNRILKEYFNLYFYLRLCVFQFFRRCFKSTKYSNRMAGSIFVKNMAYTTANCLLFLFFIFLEG